MLLEKKIQEYYDARTEIAKRRSLWKQETHQLISGYLKRIIDESTLEEFYVHFNDLVENHQSVILRESHRPEGLDKSVNTVFVRKGGQLIFGQTKNGLIWVGFKKPTNKQFGEDYECVIRFGKYEPKDIDHDLVRSSVVRFFEELTKWEKNEEPELIES